MEIILGKEYLVDGVTDIGKMRPRKAIAIAKNDTAVCFKIRCKYFPKLKDCKSDEILKKYKNSDNRYHWVSYCAIKGGEVK